MVRRVLIVLALMVVACVKPVDPAPAPRELVIPEGKPAVVNYWATWCVPCKEEMPRLVDAAKRYSDRVSFLGVNVEDDAELAEKFEDTYEIPFESVRDADGKIRDEQGILGLPVTQFYDASGELAFVHQGEIDEGDLEDRIEGVLRLS
ncbi:MAG: TlpA disulfide reductase family protein [Actinomycetota bacterium]